MDPLVVDTADYHTAGEPFRIVVGGVDPPKGATVLDRRSWSEEHLDHVRRFLVNEPRGHADMYGCFVTPPDDAGAEFGLVFFHKDGFSTACGHGTIAAAVWALEHGIVPAREPETTFAIDVPSGRLSITALAETDGTTHHVTAVRFVNVPSWVSALDVSVPGVDCTADVAYGGAFYASVEARSLGLSVEPAQLPDLISIGREIKRALADHPSVRHPTDDRLSGCYGTIWYETIESSGHHLSQRNVTVFADGEVDRSPCGSGTSSRLAILEQRGLLPSGGHLEHRSIIGTVFQGRILGEAAPVAGHRTVSTEIEGQAFLTGRHRFILHPDDDLGYGFQLR